MVFQQPKNSKKIYEENTYNLLQVHNQIEKQIIHELLEKVIDV